jgi:hypothetical protein
MRHRRKMPPIRKLDFTQGLDALSRIHRPRRALLIIPESVHAMSSDDLLHEIVDSFSRPVQVLPPPMMRTYRGQSIPEGEKSFFALREGETPRRRKSDKS